MKPDPETQARFDELDEATKKILKVGLAFEALRQEAKAVQIATKQLRNLWRERSAGTERDIVFQKAIASIEIVVNAFKERFDKIEEGFLAKRDLAVEIGDYCGIKGGTCRDWGKFKEAANAYGEGNQFARQAKALGAKSNTYCLVQELINAVLAEPEILKSRDYIEGKLKPSLAEIRQVDRKSDPWALADQALITQLVDPQQAEEEWGALDDSQPKAEVYAATRNVVVALLDRLRPHLVPDSLASWNDVSDRLK